MTKKPFSEQLRAAIREGELSRYEIWKQTEVLQSVLSRFVNGGTVSLDTVDVLVDFLDMELTRRKPAKRTPKGKG